MTERPDRTHARTTDLGRGPRATQDMKRRIAALRAEGADVVTELWRRHLDAVHGEGYRYEYAEQQEPAAATV